MDLVEALPGLTAAGLAADLGGVAVRCHGHRP
jgi:hypothetical protein